MDSNIVGLRVFNKAHGLDFNESLQESLADAVHPIHHAPVTGQDDGERKIAIKHQACMVDDLAAGELLAWSSCPIRFVEFPDGRQWYTLANKAARKQDKPADVPRAQSLWRTSEMILSPHDPPMSMLPPSGRNL